MGGDRPEPMIAEVCSAPKSGGSGRGLADYVLGYQLGAKVPASERAAAKEQYGAILAQADERADRGVGMAFSPIAGGGRRPSSVHALNVTSLATAGVEMDALSTAVSRRSSPVMHIVFSADPSESGDITDQKILDAALLALRKKGLGDHQIVLAVHRDTDHVHVHAAIGVVNPLTMRMMNKLQFNLGLSRAMRETERDIGLARGRGLYKFDTGGDIVRSSLEERKLWEAERMGPKRLERLERAAKTYEARAELDGSFERFADSAVGPRLREPLDRLRERGESATWSELHIVAAKHGCDISEPVGLSEGDRYPSPDLVNRVSGERVRLSAVLRAEDICELGQFLDYECAESQFIARLESDPGLVARAITAELSTFTREDIDRYLSARITDLGELERLGDHAEKRDAQTVLIAVDGEMPLYTTAEMKDVEARLAGHAHVLARAPGVWNADAMERAIGKLETADGFSVSAEQRAALGTLEHGQLAVIQGKPGTGKTTIMKAVRLYAEATGRDIVGLTASQTAAERLSSEAGFKAVNLMRGRVMEKMGEIVILTNGILVLDESGMTDSRMMETTLALARSRNCTVVAIGDRNQLQPVAAGAAFTVLQRESKALGAYAELNEIRRQTRAWHRDAVGAFGDALEAKSEAGIAKAIEAMDAGHRFVGFDDERAVIDRAAEIWAKDASRGQRTLVVASDRDMVRYVNEAVRRMRGFTGEHAGMAFLSTTGTKQLVPGDRFQFRENKTFRGASKSKSESARRRADEHRAPGKGTVRNGDTGEVISVRLRRIEVRLDAGEIVAFDPTKYQSWSHGYASTIHASQGASVDKVVVLVGRGASAELMHVALSRAKKSMEVLFSRGDYTDAKEIGERVARNIGTKITSQTIDEYVTKTGGLDSSRATDAARRHAGDIDPVRNRYVAAMRERETSAVYASDAIRERFGRVRERVMKDSQLSVGERAERCAKLATDMLRELKRARREHAAEPFGKWLKTERAGEPHVVARREIRAKKNREERVKSETQQTLEKQRTEQRSRSRGR